MIGAVAPGTFPRVHEPSVASTEAAGSEAARVLAATWARRPTRIRAATIESVHNQLGAGLANLLGDQHWRRALRYRLLSYRYALVMRLGQPGPFGDLWQTDRLRLQAQARWRPDADAYETATTIEIVVDLAGVGEDDFELQLFEDALVVEGRRQLPSCDDEAVYQSAGIRQGPFRLEVPLSAPVDAERVAARSDHGLLRITLPKRETAR